MSPHSTKSVKVRLVNGDIVEVPHISPNTLLVAMEELPHDEKLDIIKEGAPDTIKLADIAMVCIETHSTNFRFIPTQVLQAVNALKFSSQASKQIRQERAGRGLYSVPPLPPLNGRHLKTF